MTAGPLLFARYAFPPNDRGLCGPDDWVSLHWDCVCDRLSRPQLLALRRFTDYHLRLANAARRGTASA